MKVDRPARMGTFVLAAISLIGFRTAASAVGAEIVKSRTGKLTDGFGGVLYLPGGTNEIPARYPSNLNFDDAVRTLRRAHAGMEFNLSPFNMHERSRLVIVRSDRLTNGVVVRLLEGQGYYVHRGPPGLIPIETPHVAAVAMGTEFLVSVDLGANL